jgi:methionine-rich copper-binding protein CopC
MAEMRILRPALLLCAIASVAFLGLTANASAAYRSSIPANGTTVATAPAQVFLTFTGATSTTRSSGSVVDSHGAAVSTGWSLDPGDHATMTILLKPGLGSGVYTVQYTSDAEDDGAVTNGSFIFTVAPAAATSVRSGGSGGAPWGLLLAVGAAVVAFVACGLVIVVRSRREYLAMMAREATQERRERLEDGESDASPRRQR